VFVTFGRAAVAGVLSLVYLVLTRSPRPRGRQWAALAFTACCVVVGFPLFMALGLRHVESVHASVVTASCRWSRRWWAAVWLRQRPSVGFWVCAVAGSALVAPSCCCDPTRPTGSAAQWADLLLLLAMLSAACGYVSGGQLTSKLGAERVICWVLVISLPLTLPVMVLSRPLESGSAQRLDGVCLRGADFDVARVLCLVPWPGAGRHGAGQPGATGAALPEHVVLGAAAGRIARPAMTVGFALAVIATVFIGKRMPVSSGGVPSVAPRAPKLTSKGRP
jgi:hypothetical protein